MTLAIHSGMALIVMIAFVVACVVDLKS